MAAGGGQIVKAGPHALQADGLVIPDSNGNGAPGPRHDAIEALVVTLTERDGYTGEHSEAVVAMSGAVARNLGLRDTEVEWVRSAALLHDIGKVAIPDEILHKPGPLTDDEWAKGKEKAVAEELSAGIGIPAPVLEIALKRQTYGIKPLDNNVVAEQQRIADTFFALGLLPKPIVVSTIVRKSGS